VAFADGPFTIDKNTSITIPALANDTITDPISIVIVPNPLYGNAAVNPDNTVIDTPFVNAVGADLFDYAITDGSYTSSASVRLNIGVDPYVIYKADVSLANQLYFNKVLTEAATRQTSIDGARVAAQSSALQAYADYDIAVLQAKQGYSASASLAETNYQSAVQTATATYQSSSDQAYTTYNAAVDSVYTTYNATMAVIDQTHLNALAAADAAYGGAVAPYQTALNSAQANYDANPENPEAQAALALAQANFDAAVAPAMYERNGAYASAAADKQTAQAAAEVALITADDAAMTDLLSNRGAADQTWTTAEATAWMTYGAAKADADNVLVNAEGSAWLMYTGAVAQLESDLAFIEFTAQTEFDMQMTSALTAWQSREATAWTTYMTEMAKQPGAPPLGARILEPGPVEFPAVVAFAGFAVQVRLQTVLLALAPPRESNLPFNSKRARFDLEATFDIELRKIVVFVKLERDNWQAHHLWEVGSYGNGQILANRFLASDPNFKINDPSNMYLLPTQVHSTVNTLNSNFWAQQMTENKWTRVEAYEKVNLTTYKAHQEKMRELIKPYALGRNSIVNDLTRVRDSLGLTGSNSVGSQAALDGWRQGRREKLADWGKQLGITTGVIAVLGKLQAGLGTAGQIVNPSEKALLCLDDALRNYEQVLARQLRGDTILITDTDLLDLAGNFDKYLAAIQADDTFRGLTYTAILSGISR